MAGPPGLEPETTVLETVMIPFHHGPMLFIYFKSLTSLIRLAVLPACAGRETVMIPFHHGPMLI